MTNPEGSSPWIPSPPLFVEPFPPPSSKRFSFPPRFFKGIPILQRYDSKENHAFSDVTILPPTLPPFVTPSYQGPPPLASLVVLREKQLQKAACSSNYSLVSPTAADFAKVFPSHVLSYSIGLFQDCSFCFGVCFFCVSFLGLCFFPRVPPERSKYPPTPTSFLISLAFRFLPLAFFPFSTYEA